MSSWKGRSRGGITGYKVFIFILKYLGLGAAHFVLRFVAGYFFLFVPRSFKLMYDFFHRKLKLSSVKSIRSIYRNYYLFGQVILDKFAVMGGLKDKFSYEFEGEEHLRQMVREHTGGLLISAHVGNWDIASALLNRIGGKINIVIFEGEHARIKKFTENKLNRAHVNFIALKPDFSHIFQIGQALQNKELICIHGDRFLAGAKVSEQTFFNQQAYFPLGPFELASRFGVPCTFVFAMKHQKRHYHFFATPPKVYNRNPETALADFVKILEEKVRLFPEQWFNYYPFWIETKQ